MRVVENHGNERRRWRKKVENGNSILISINYEKETVSDRNIGRRQCWLTKITFQMRCQACASRRQAAASSRRVLQGTIGQMAAMV